MVIIYLYINGVKVEINSQKNVELLVLLTY